jgi:SAM-dependent methyltransferase
MRFKQISQTVVSNLAKGLNRRDAVAQAMPADAHILEIGPGGYPLFRKSAFPNLKIADYCGTDELMRNIAQQFKLPTVPREHFEEVDYICADGKLTEIIPPELKFDLIFSSHNIEHQPNLILHLQNVEALLRDDGVAVFAVPDKRFTYDVFRQTSTTSDLLLAYQEGRSAPSAKAVFDAALQTATLNFSDCRKIGFDDSVALGDLDAAYKNFLARGAAADSDYVDVHNWVFTPQSFQIIAIELYLLKLSSLMYEFCSDAIGNAFLCIMAKKQFPADQDASTRLALEMKARLLDSYKRMVFSGE